VIRAAIALAAVLAMTAQTCDAKTHRNPAARADFKRAHPCPANGKKSGACPGYVIDHVVPLCAGGPDHPGNMQWQTIAAAKAKDRIERQQCRHSK